MSTWFPFTTSTRNLCRPRKLKFFNFHSLHFFQLRGRGVRYFLTSSRIFLQARSQKNDEWKPRFKLQIILAIASEIKTFCYVPETLSKRNLYRLSHWNYINDNIDTSKNCYFWIRYNSNKSLILLLTGDSRRKRGLPPLHNILSGISSDYQIQFLNFLLDICGTQIKIIEIHQINNTEFIWFRSPADFIFFQ